MKTLPLEQQVCSHPLAAKLKELGVPQNSWFYHRSPSPQHGRPEWSIDTCIDTHAEENYSAFSVAELGQMLPVTIKMKGVTHFYETNKTSHNHRCGYVYFDDDGKISGWGRLNDTVSHSVGESPMEANARAKMLILLLEQGLINPTEL